MAQEKKYDVFISYSRKDSAIADEIRKAFDQVGITYFIDREEIKIEKTGTLPYRRVLVLFCFPAPRCATR